MFDVFSLAEHHSQCSSKRKSSAGSNGINGTDVAAQTQPIIQSSPELQSIQQQQQQQLRAYEQQYRQRHIESQQTNDRSELTAAATRATAREARPTGTKRKN